MEILWGGTISAETVELCGNCTKLGEITVFLVVLALLEKKSHPVVTLEVF